jgi:hypothetical protein
MNFIIANLLSLRTPFSLSVQIDLIARNNLVLYSNQGITWCSSVDWGGAGGEGNNDIV